MRRKKQREKLERKGRGYCRGMTTEKLLGSTKTNVDFFFFSNNHKTKKSYMECG